MAVNDSVFLRCGQGAVPIGKAVLSMPRPAALKQRNWFTTAREALFSLFSSSSSTSSSSSHILTPPIFRLRVFVCHSRLPLSSPLRNFAIVAHLILISRLVFAQIGNPHNKNISLNFLQLLSHAIRTLFSYYTSLSIAFLPLSCHIGMSILSSFPVLPASVMS